MGSLWNRSGTIERYGADDLPARSAKAFFFQGGTTSPMTVFADAAEGSAHPHPVVADANGRWPNVFVPYTLSYDVQVVNQFNVELTYTQEIPNPDPVELTFPPPSNGGGEGTTILQPGMTHWEPIQGARAGFVRCNGRTIGNAVSGGTERQNDDCVNLFAYLWNALLDAQAPVSGGRGGSAGADFIAGKTIRLPDLRGALPVGLDNMGNAIAGSFPGAVPWANGAPTIPGSAGGGNSVVLAANQVPSHTHPLTMVPDLHEHSYIRPDSQLGANLDLSANVHQVCINLVTRVTNTVHIFAVVEANAGGNEPANNVPRVITGTWYMKL